MRRKHVYQFFILLLQCVCGGLVVKEDYSFIVAFAAIILPTAIGVAILFKFYDREVIKEFKGKEADCHEELFEEIINHCDSIIETCQRTTSGNYMHNIAQNRFSAKMIKQCVEIIKKEFGLNEYTMNEVSIIINGVRYDMVRVLEEDACCCYCDLRPFCDKYDLVNFVSRVLMKPFSRNPIKSLKDENK